MKSKKISDRRLNKKTDPTKTILASVMTSLLGDSGTKKAQFLSPIKRPDGRYVTSEGNLDRSIDPRIFRETQLRRLLRWLTTKPPLLNVFFNWLFVKKIGMKLNYFSENEDKNPDAIFKDKTKGQHQIVSEVKDGFTVHNLGHATQLIQTEGMNILTDPVFGDLSKVFYPSMTKKFNRDIRPDELPRIDVILISHNHRDHVDEDSLRKLIKLGQQPQLLVPMGNLKFFRNLGFRHVRELEWHQAITLASPSTHHKVTFCCAPADHRSGRNGFDSHQSLVNGWVISPKSRDEIAYFAGDTARLNDTRMLSLALDIYALYKHKKLDPAAHTLPQIINMVPGGPNYTRKDMKPTHQSAVDSVASAFRLAIELANVSKKDGHDIPPQQWLEATATVFMHHNKFELGPDRFNENVFIYNRICSYLNMDDAAFRKQCEKQERKSQKWSVFHRRKDFITNGVVKLVELSNVIWPEVSVPVRKKRLLEFIQARTHFPLINEKVSAKGFFQFKKGETSTIKPTTNRGMKPKVK